MVVVEYIEDIVGELNLDVVVGWPIVVVADRDCIQYDMDDDTRKIKSRCYYLKLPNNFIILTTGTGWTVW